MKEVIQSRLHKALLAHASMSYALYKYEKYELEEHLDYWKASMRRDGDDLLFVVTENSGDVAVLLLTKQGQLFINGLAREKLRLLWNFERAYEHNITALLPVMAAQLAVGNLWVNGVQTMQ